ncbi:MAG: hypothetical protein AAF583_07135 [Pseudomonadota bacterium]
MDDVATSRAGRKPRFDAKRKALYLEALAETGVISEAMKACGVASRTTLKNAREGDPEFVTAEQDALDAAADLVEMVLHTRSIYGQEVPVVDELGRAVLDPTTGEVKKAYLPPDNRLLIARAKALKPEKYATERRHVTKSGSSTLVIMPAQECEVEFERMLAEQADKTKSTLREKLQNLESD